MGEGIISTIVDKLIDELLSNIIGRSKEEIAQLINGNKLQKILLHVIDKSAKSDIFNTEFRHFTYAPQSALILAVEDSKIDIKLSLDELKVNLDPIIKECFISDEENYELMTEYICVSYIQQAHLTASIVDILEVQKESYEDIMGGLDKVKQLILDSQQRELNIQAKKTQLVKSILSNELAHSVIDMMNVYLYFIHKESVSLPLNGDVSQKGMIKAQSQVIEETLGEMSQLIDMDFCMKPIITVGVGKHQSEISYFKFCEYYFIATINNRIDRLIKYDYIMPESIYIILLEIKNIIEGDIFAPVCSNGMEEFIVSAGVKADVEAFTTVLSRLGRVLLELKQYIID